MQYYKKRDFGSIISDTFAFFKENGKNYFKNYIFINGILLILMVAIFAFGYREIISQMFNSNTGGQNYYFEAYFQENRVMLIIISVLVFLLFMVFSMVAYTYPVLYLKRLSETGNRNIKADDIVGDLKSNTGRFVKLFLGLTFVVMPLAMIVFGISYLMIFILIGFFLLILVGPAMMNVIYFLLYDYFHRKTGFFESLSYSVRAQFSYPSGNEPSPFWKYWGSTMVMYMIVQVISSLFTIIPMIILFSSIYTMEQSGTVGQNPFEGTIGIVFFVFYGLAILFSFLMMNVMIIASGLQYYDSRTDLHRALDISEIDTIGTQDA